MRMVFLILIIGIIIVSFLIYKHKNRRDFFFSPKKKNTYDNDDIHFILSKMEEEYKKWSIKDYTHKVGPAQNFRKEISKETLIEWIYYHDEILRITDPLRKILIKKFPELNKDWSSKYSLNPPMFGNHHSRDKLQRHINFDYIKNNVTHLCSEKKVTFYRKPPSISSNNWTKWIKYGWIIKENNTFSFKQNYDCVKFDFRIFNYGDPSSYAIGNVSNDGRYKLYDHPWFSDRLFNTPDAHFSFFDKIQDWYRDWPKRLTKTCNIGSSDCFSDNYVRPWIWPIFKNLTTGPKKYIIYISKLDMPHEPGHSVLSRMKDKNTGEDIHPWHMLCGKGKYPDICTEKFDFFNPKGTRLVDKDSKERILYKNINEYEYLKGFNPRKNMPTLTQQSDNVKTIINFYKFSKLESETVEGWKPYQNLLQKRSFGTGDIKTFIEFIFENYGPTPTRPPPSTSGCWLFFKYGCPNKWNWNHLGQKSLHNWWKVTQESYPDKLKNLPENEYKCEQIYKYWTKLCDHEPASIKYKFISNAQPTTTLDSSHSYPTKTTQPTITGAQPTTTQDSSHSYPTETTQPKTTLSCQKCIYKLNY